MKITYKEDQITKAVRARIAREYPRLDIASVSVGGDESGDVSATIFLKDSSYISLEKEAVFALVGDLAAADGMKVKTAGFSVYVFGGGHSGPRTTSVIAEVDGASAGASAPSVLPMRVQLKEKMLKQLIAAAYASKKMTVKSCSVKAADKIGRAALTITLPSGLQAEEELIGEDLNTVLSEALTSRGYVVVAGSYTFSATDGGMARTAETTGSVVVTKLGQ